MRWLGALAPLALVGGPSAADILCSNVAILFLVHSAWQREFSWLRQDWLAAGLALWAYLCIRALFAADIQAALAQALPFGRFVIFAAALQSLVLNGAVWRARLALFAAIGLTFLALDGLLQYVTGRDILGHALSYGRIVAVYNHPIVGTIITWLFIPAALALVAKKQWLLALGFGLLCLSVILLSGDRMAMLLALLAIGLLGLFALQSRRALRVYLIVVPLTLVVLGSIVYLRPAIYQRQVASSIEMIRELPRSHYGVIWTSALRMTADHPLFGVGPRAFRDVCPDAKYGPLEPYRAGDFRCSTHPHNLYLEWLVESGTVGLALFVFAMALIVRRFLRGLRGGPPDWVFVGLLVTLLARLWPLASSTSFHHAWLGMPFWLIVGWGLAYLSPNGSAPQGKTRVAAR
jgi:O-antigen ligase